MMDDTQAVSVLHGLAMRQTGAAELGSVLHEICDIAMALANADFGSVQLIDPASSNLKIVAQHGLPPSWVDFWNAAPEGQGACGSAVETQARVVVENVAWSPLFAGRTSLDVQLEAGIRAMQSTPLLTRTGKAVGVVSTYFRQPCRPDEQVLRWLDLLARQAADSIENAWAAAALQESETRFRALVMATTSDVVYSMRPDWSHMRFLKGKGFVADLPGASDDRLAGYIDAGDQPRVSEAIRNAVRTRTAFDLEHRVRRADGSLGWTHSRAVPLLGADGNIVEWLGVASDVTDSRQTAAELLDEQRRLRALLEALPVGVAFTNSPSCEHVTGNKALLEQFGAGADDNVSASASNTEAHGRQVVYLHEGRPLAADDLPLQSAVREGRTIAPMEVLVQLPTGRQISVEVSGAPIRNTEGSVVGAVAVVADISERQRAVQAREQVRLKDEFLAVLGHELRNPLAAISTAVDLLNSKTTAQRDTVDAVIRSQVAVLRRLVDDLLDISGFALGSLRLQHESVSLLELLGTAAAAVRPMTEERAQELAIGLPAADVRFPADRVRLQQILANLLDNASKYSGHGGRIELSGDLEGAEVVLRCRDSGRGIAPEAQERIFEPLVRLETAPDDAPGGLGLGLTLVRHLAQLHGGSASVKSRGLGAGSEFIVRIPFDGGAALQAPPAAAPPDPDARTPGLSVVIVEDNPDVAQILTLGVERAGHRVIRFADGPAALASVPELAPDVVLLDTGLPGMSGLELLAKLRPHPRLRGTLFIGMSGLAPDGEPGAGSARFDHFLIKPVDIKELPKLLRRRAPEAE